MKYFLWMSLTFILIGRFSDCLELPDIMYDELMLDSIFIEQYHFLKDILEKIPSITQPKFYKIEKPIFRECPCKIRSRMKSKMNKIENKQTDYFAPLEDIDNVYINKKMKNSSPNIPLGKTNSSCNCKNKVLNVKDYSFSKNHFEANYYRVNIHRKHRIHKNIKYALMGQAK